MSPGIVVSIGFLLGVFVSVVSVAMWRQSRDTPGPRREIGHGGLLAEIDEPTAFQRKDGTVIFSNEAFRDLVGTDPVGEEIESVLSILPELQRRVLERDEGIATVESETGTTYYDVSIYSNDSGPDGQLLLCLDVTGRHERRCRLEEQNETLDTFASLVSHDLRNPLDVAIGRTNVVAESADDPELQTHVEKTQQALDRMEAIISRVLVLARRGDVIGETTPVSLEEISEQCWKTVETGDVTLLVETDAVIEANRDGLSHVFENLFRNSVEHGSASQADGDGEEESSSSRASGHDPRAETVDAAGHTSEAPTVRVESIEGGFAVEDDGPGIPADQREQVCEPGETTKQCGTGLGLAIVDRIASAHGWELDVTESESGGARFEFTGVERLAEDVATREF